MKLAVHNVVQLTDAEVRDRFVVRHHELNELLVHLREDDPPRHVLVIGQRGMGKSLLLHRVALAVADAPDLSARWLPVTMPEELYDVTSIGELWLAALKRLAVVLDDSDLARQHDSLRTEPDLSRLGTLALQRLLGASRARGRKILLLAENLDMLLHEQVSSEEGWVLRQALQTEDDLLLMATAVTTFAQIDDAGEALYGFFHRVDLRPLDDGDVRTLWRHVTGIDLDRAAPVRILTGGNARLVTVLGDFSQRPDLGSLRRDLELLIDGYTPFFKANIEMLPTVERKVFVTLAEIWAPATAAQVADRARMNSSKVSAILGRLVRRGAVAVVDQDQGKQRYELTERLYNLYHLLRRPESEGRVRALVDILTHLYDPGRLEREVFPRILRPQAEMPLSDLDLRIASRLECHIDEAGVWDDLTPAECDARLAMLQSLLEDQQASLGDDHPDTLLTRHQVADFTGQTGNARAAVDLFRQVAADRELVLGPDHPHTLTSRHGLAHYLGETGDARAALDLYRQVAADSERVLGPDHPHTLTSRHEVAHYLGETGDARAALDLYRQVAADSERVLGPAHPHTLISRHQVARYLGETGDAQAALHTAEQVLRSAESLPANNAFLQAIRGLRDLLELRVKRDASKPLPRELREVLEAIDRREHQRAGEPPVSRGRPRRREGGGGRGPLRRGR
jgi:hypothetical protein